MSLTLKDLRVLTGKRVVVIVARNDDMVHSAEHRPATVPDIVEVLKSEGAEVAELGMEHFYWEDDDHLDAPGRYLVFRLDEEQ